MGRRRREGQYDEVTVNKLGSYIRTYRAQIGFNDPRVKVIPRTSDGYTPVPVPVLGVGGQPEIDPMTMQPQVRMITRASLREALINDILEAPLHNTQAVNSRLVKSGTLAWGTLKSGYDPSFTTDPEPEGDQEIPIGEDGSLSFDDYAKNPVSGDIEVDDNNRLIRRDMVPVYEDFFIRWVPYWNMIIDPDGGNDWMDHRWVAEEIVRPLADVKADPLFKNTKDLKPSGYRKDNEDGIEWHTSSAEWAAEDDEIRREAEVVRLFEIYDLVNTRLIVLADGYGKYLRDEPTPMGITGHPYSDFRPNELTSGTAFYPRPIATDLRPVGQLYNIARTQEVRAMKKSTRKVLDPQGVLGRSADGAVDQRHRHGSDRG